MRQIEKRLAVLQEKVRRNARTCLPIHWDRMHIWVDDWPAFYKWALELFETGWLSWDKPNWFSERPMWESGPEYDEYFNETRKVRVEVTQAGYVLQGMFDRCPPENVSYPSNTDEVIYILKWCVENEIPVGLDQFARAVLDVIDEDH